MKRFTLGLIYLIIYAVVIFISALGPASPMLPIFSDGMFFITIVCGAFIGAFLGERFVSKAIWFWSASDEEYNNVRRT